MQMPHEPTGESGNCCDWQTFETRANQYVRTEPAKSVGFAFIAGILLTILPVGRLISAIVRLAFLLIRPLLLLLGAVKIYEEFEKRNR